MGDLAATFRAWDQDKKFKRIENKKKYTQALRDLKINFSSHNNDHFLIIRCPKGGVLIFWPSSCKWRENGIVHTNHGFTSLLGRIERG